MCFRLKNGCKVRDLFLTTKCFPVFLNFFQAVGCMLQKSYPSRSLSPSMVRYRVQNPLENSLYACLTKVSHTVSVPSSLSIADAKKYGFNITANISSDFLTLF